MIHVVYAAVGAAVVIGTVALSLLVVLLIMFVLDEYVRYDVDEMLFGVVLLGATLSVFYGIGWALVEAGL